MREIVGGWEAVSCRVKQPWHSVSMVLQFLLGNPDIIPVFFNCEVDGAADGDRNDAQNDSEFQTRGQG